ncbi:hypothetical protein Tco_0321249 [Tanacetum coccineum]
MSQPANDDYSQHLSDDEASYHEDASDNGTATNKPKQQQQLTPTTTTISNIKLLILKKEEYDIWAMEMEHYLEYIDNDVWKVIQNGNSKKRISTRKDGVVRILPPVSATEIHAVEKERKARTILLRFGSNANSKKMQKVVLKQQFEAFTISSSEGLEKGYDRLSMIAIRMKKFYKKTERRVWIDKRSLNITNVTTLVILLENAHLRGQMMERRETPFIKIKERKSKIRTVC